MKRIIERNIKSTMDAVRKETIEAVKKAGHLHVNTDGKYAVVILSTKLDEIAGVVQPPT